MLIYYSVSSLALKFCSLNNISLTQAWNPRMSSSTISDNDFEPLVTSLITSHFVGGMKHSNLVGFSCSFCALRLFRENFYVKQRGWNQNKWNAHEQWEGEKSRIFLIFWWFARKNFQRQKSYWKFKEFDGKCWRKFPEILFCKVVAPKENFVYTKLWVFNWRFEEKLKFSLLSFWRFLDFN